MFRSTGPPCCSASSPTSCWPSRCFSACPASPGSLSSGPSGQAKYFAGNSKENYTKNRIKRKNFNGVVLLHIHYISLQVIDPCCVTVSGPLWRRCAGARCAPTPGIHSLYKSNLIRKFYHNYSYLSLLNFSPSPGSFRFSAAASADTGTGPRPLTTRV